MLRASLASLTPQILAKFAQQENTPCSICDSSYGVKVRCPGNPTELLWSVYRRQAPVPPHQQQMASSLCEVQFHPECARKAHFNLSLRFKEVYCREHRKQLRLEAYGLFRSVRKKEITDFAANLEVCQEYFEQKNSL